MSDPEAAVDHPFGGFRVTTETMPDGRQIHYYEWPADEPGATPPGPEHGPEPRDRPATRRRSRRATGTERDE